MTTEVWVPLLAVGLALVWTYLEERQVIRLSECSSCVHRVLSPIEGTIKAIRGLI